MALLNKTVSMYSQSSQQSRSPVKSLGYHRSELMKQQDQFLLQPKILMSLRMSLKTGKHVVVCSGGSYKYSDKLTLKAGCARDNTPVQDDYRTARIPDADRNWLTIGAKYEAGQDWTIDAAYGYLFSSAVKISEEAHNTDKTVKVPAETLTGENKTKESACLSQNASKH